MLPSKALVVAHSAGVLAPVSVANRPLLAHALEWLSAGGAVEVAILADPLLAPRAKASVASTARRVDAHWIEHDSGGCPGVPLAAITEFMRGEPFILHLADSLARQPLRALESQLTPAQDDEVVVATLAGAGSDVVIDLHERRRAERFAGIAAVGRGAHNVLTALGSTSDPSLDGLALRARQGGASVRTFAMEPSWRLRPGARALLDGNRFALESLRADHDRATVVGAEIQGPVVLDTTAHVESSLIRGPVIVGPRARIREAYIGPYTSIASDAFIEGAEIEHSIVLDGASVMHLGTRLEASIIGPHARLFRDFRLPKALRVQVGLGAEVVLA
jgi:glucose-1-phosphate thymidylyltransferase